MQTWSGFHEQMVKPGHLCMHAKEDLELLAILFFTNLFKMSLLLLHQKVSTAKKKANYAL